MPILFNDDQISNIIEDNWREWIGDNHEDINQWINVSPEPEKASELGWQLIVKMDKITFEFSYSDLTNDQGYWNGESISQYACVHIPFSNETTAMSLREIDIVEEVWEYLDMYEEGVDITVAANRVRNIKDLAHVVIYKDNDDYFVIAKDSNGHILHLKKLIVDGLHYDHASICSAFRCAIPMSIIVMREGK